MGGSNVLGAVWVAQAGGGSGVVGVVRAVWAVRAREGPGTHWQPLNTF